MRKKKIRYGEEIICFDIETTHEIINGQDAVYTWHWQAMKEDEYYTFTGWDHFYTTILSWVPDDKDRIIIFVHNLAYETESIIRNINGHMITDLFATDTHKPLKFVFDEKIEFRCSYLLTNKSLAGCGADVGLEKLDLDYTRIRRPGDPISDEEEMYCRRDVEIMVAKIRQLEKQENCHFWDFPLTNTGFLRNEARKIMRKNKDNRREFRRSALDYDRFTICREAFTGGYVHANYLYSGRIVDQVDSFDFGSAYPFAILAHRMPSGYLHRISNPTYHDIQFFRKKENCLFICRVQLINCICQYNNTFLSLNKCITRGRTQTDNGRIFSAEFLETACTSLDLDIILDVYKPEKIRVVEMYWSKADYLPKEFILLMVKYYKAKQALKHVPGEEYNYIKAKNRVNSFFGMAVTSPLHDTISLDMTEWIRERINYHDPMIVNQQLTDFYESYNSFLPYQWGVFIPAWTRWHLWHDIIIPCDHQVVYSDTDSVKVVNVDLCWPAINRYNDWVAAIKKERLPDLGLQSDDLPDLGVFDWETSPAAGGTWKHFMTLGAKKYMIQTQDDHYYLTVSGLSKQAVNYMHGFDDFTPGVVFDADVSGRTVSHCIDNPEGAPDGGGCWIEDTTYTLSISDEYRIFLEEYGDQTGPILSDLVISADRRYHRGDTDNAIDDKIDVVGIQRLRNLYNTNEGDLDDT